MSENESDDYGHIRPIAIYHVDHALAGYLPLNAL